MNTQQKETIAKLMSLEVFYNFLDGEKLSNKGKGIIMFKSKKQEKTFLKKVTDAYNHYNCEETKNKAIQNAGQELAIDIELQ